MQHRGFLLALGCAVLVACGDGDGGGAAGERSAAAAPAANGESRDAGMAEPFPPPGGVQARLDADALVSAVANQALRGAILEALARTGGFELVVGTEAKLQESLTLRAEREPLEVVLARVVAGVPHELDYQTDPISGLARLSRVRVGLDDEFQGAVATFARPHREKHEPRRELPPEQPEERTERSGTLWAHSLEKLQSSDPEVRADGAQWLNVNSTEGFHAAVERLAEDESPMVRAAAAEALLDSDVGAVQPLLQALEDPDPRVVLAALEALEFVGDASTVPQIAPLLKHKDVEVRERTVEAIEFLQ